MCQTGTRNKCDNKKNESLSPSSYSTHYTFFNPRQFSLLMQIADLPRGGLANRIIPPPPRHNYMDYPIKCRDPISGTSRYQYGVLPHEMQIFLWGGGFSLRVHIHIWAISTDCYQVPRINAGRASCFIITCNSSF